MGKWWLQLIRTRQYDRQMKKFILFLVISLASAYFFGSEEIAVNRKEGAISESPAFASAEFVEIVKTGGKKPSSYRVRCAFQVSGTQYEELVAYLGLGILSTRTSYEVTLDTLNKKIGDLDPHGYATSFV
jgi:hypothetical protein